MIPEEAICGSFPLADWVGYSSVLRLESKIMATLNEILIGTE